MRDRELNRTLAMKVMLGAHSLSHRMRAGRGEGLRGSTPISHPLLTRFLEEVQVTAHLDHPGIVAVHELGLDAAGRPYFTIKLERKSMKLFSDPVGCWMLFCGAVFMNLPTLRLAIELNIGVKPSDRSGLSTGGAGA